MSEQTMQTQVRLHLKKRLIHLSFKMQEMFPEKVKIK